MRPKPDQPSALSRKPQKSEERIIVLQYAPRTLIDHVICASEMKKIRESRES